MAVLNVTDTNFENALSENSKSIVKYYAGWCGSCRLFAPKYKRLSEEEDFKNIAFLEVDAEENPEARKKAGVDNLPYFAVFQNGELLKAGSTAKEDFVRELLAEFA